jgi:hypothetical protein
MKLSENKLGLFNCLKTLLVIHTIWYQRMVNRFQLGIPQIQATCITSSDNSLSNKMLELIFVH